MGFCFVYKMALLLIHNDYLCIDKNYNYDLTTIGIRISVG